MKDSRGNGIVEFPLSTVKFMGRRLPCSGGGYFRLLPYCVHALGARKINRDDKLPFIFYLHPWEIDPGQPRFKASWLSRFRHYTNLSSVREAARRARCAISASPRFAKCCARSWTREGRRRNSMCGLAGIHLDSREARPDRERVERMIAAIGHRGPDGTGFHIEPGVALGHARLSIIDLGGGAQPIHNGDETVWISYNGEVFNYIELRKWLEARGHKFYTHTDTEVIVHLYDELGDEFVHELNGQFAFALWDRKRRRLLLVRDRAGILPLYYARVAGGVVFAFRSEDADRERPRAAARWIPLGLDELMTFWAPVAPRTVFKGVSQVCPGEMVILEGAS